MCRWIIISADSSFERNENAMKPLEGILVLDLTQFVSGPMCTLTLCDLGAEVIKIERLGFGDDTRNETPSRKGTSAKFISCNRGKKSVELNLKDDRHKEIFRNLVKKADVVVENYKPGTMKKFGLDYEALKAIKPDLIYAAISGFGQTGPYSSRGALDIAVQAMSGFMSLTGEKGGKPVKAGTSVADVVAGLYGAIGVLAALQYRAKTGQGQFVDVAMLDSMVASVMVNEIARYNTNGIVPVPQGNRHAVSAPFQEFATKDGSIMVCCPTNAQFKTLMEALGHPEVYEDIRFKESRERYQNKDELEEAMQPIFAGLTTAEAAQIMAAYGLPFGEINRVDAVAQNEQLQARDMFIEVEDSTAGVFRTVGFPLKMQSTPYQPCFHSPGLGEDTHAVLKNLLGMSDDEIARAFE